MNKTIDLTGQKIGRWTVIKRMPNGKSHHTMWLCKCECGTEKIVNRTNLRNGSSKSCGCLRREKHILKYGLASMRAAILTYIYNAKKRGVKWEFTEEQFYKLTQQDCYYCGSKPNNTRKRKFHNGSYTYNGLDRIDNNKGYTIGNVVPCCKICNVAKNNLTLQEYKDWIKKSYNYQNQENIN